MLIAGLQFFCRGPPRLIAGGKYGMPCERFRGGLSVDLGQRFEKSQANSQALIGMSMIVSVAAEGYFL